MTVSLHVDSSRQIVLEIKDNGKGMPENYQRRHDSFGLIGMRERATIMLGGAMQIHSGPFAGTSIEIIVTYDKAPLADA